MDKLDKITIKEVANYANVAVSTVSRVINNQDRVSEKTRARIKDAIDKLGYVRNPMAASIKTGATGCIVTVVPDFVNEFYSSVVGGVEAIASKHNYFSLVYSTNELQSKELEVFDGEFSHMVEGVILVPSTANTAIYEIGKPTVIIDRDIPGSNLYSVSVDNYKGVSLLMEEFLQKGHHKIAIITGPSIFNVGIDRLNAYIDVLRKNRISIRDDYICQGSWYIDDGYSFTGKLLALDDPPTAILAANNLLCTGCIEYLCDHNIAIGKDISIAGFDDSSIARYISPGITVIKRPTDELGRKGAEMLMSLLSDKSSDITNKKVVLDVELIRRNSIATL